jgi:tRNA threonylcarbamoyl adenosine modification protein YeaZ
MTEIKQLYLIQLKIVMNYALAIHTSSPELGLAISNFAGDSRCQTWELGRDMSTLLHTHLQDFMSPQTWQDLSFLAVAKGPGGFTGTRIGVVTARTLSQQLGIPLFAISTLAAFIWWERSHLITAGEPVSDDLDIAVQMPAQRGTVFVAMYSIKAEFLDNSETSLAPLELVPLIPDTLLNHELWQQMLQTWHRPYRLIRAEGNLGASVMGLLELAYLEWKQGIRPDWSTTIPFYG